MYLKEVYVRTQSLDACINCVKNMFSTESDAIDHWPIIYCALRQRKLSSIVAHTKVTFGEQRDVLAGYIILFQSFANNALTVSMRVEVGLFAVST
jgi:hypothetical protein